MDGCDYSTKTLECGCSTTWTWIIGVVAVLALIFVIIIWIVYFLEREGFLTPPQVFWTLSPVVSSTNIPGDNFVLYTINTALNSVTIQPPDGSATSGSWFAIANFSGQSVEITPGDNVQFESSTFPRTLGDDSTDIISISRLESGKTWFLAWTGTGTLSNLAPGGINTITPP